MRIEKTETVELLDWEKENGLEIVVNNCSTGYRAILKSVWLTDGSNKSLFGYGVTIDSALTDLASNISYKQISKYPDNYVEKFFEDISSYNYHNYITIICPLLVHTKLVEQEVKKEPKYFIQESILTTKEQPPIDAEGWEQISENRFVSKTYKPLKKGEYKIVLDIYPGSRALFIDNIFDLYFSISGKNINHFITKINIEGYDFKQQCFKIANYICSRLCDKIEK